MAFDSSSVCRVQSWCQDRFQFQVIKEDFLSDIESRKPPAWTWEEDEWEIDTSHPHYDEDGFATREAFQN